MLRQSLHMPRGWCEGQIWGVGVCCYPDVSLGGIIITCKLKTKILDFTACLVAPPALTQLSLPAPLAPRTPLTPSFKGVKGFDSSRRNTSYTSKWEDGHRVYVPFLCFCLFVDEGRVGRLRKTTKQGILLSLESDCS